MAYLHTIGVTLILSLLPTAAIAHANGPGIVRMDSATEATLTKANLDKIKRFLLKRGQTCTYNNMFSDQPCISTEHFSFYLRPDPGPHNEIQWNMGCDPKIGDFNMLVVHRDLQGSGEYRTIIFKDEHKVALELRYAERYAGSRMSKAKIRDFPAQAVEELLTVIEQHEKGAAPIK